MGLTKTETAILANAARRETRGVLPLPRFIFVRGLSIIIALEKLVRLGLIAERHAAGGEPIWRQGRTPTTLELTAAGLAALSRGENATADPAPALVAEDIRHFVLMSIRHFVLMSIMSRPLGTDVKRIQHETSLPLQSVRAAISGLRAEGYVFDHVRDGHGGTSYQLIGWLPGDGGPKRLPMSGALHA